MSHIVFHLDGWRNDFCLNPECVFHGRCKDFLEAVRDVGECEMRGEDSDTDASESVFEMRQLQAASAIESRQNS